jgi:hypothetical protein
MPDNRATIFEKFQSAVTQAEETKKDLESGYTDSIAASEVALIQQREAE